MKKNYLLSLLAIIMGSLISVGMSSCGDDDELEKSGQDPDGTVVANIINDGSALEIEGGSFFTLKMYSNNNFGVDFPYYVQYARGGEIVSVGSVKGLGSINIIPENGWSREVAVIPGTGYVVRISVPVTWQDVEIKGEIHSEPSSYAYSYSRLYVVDYMTSTIGGIMGATIKYQGKWKTPFDK